MKKAISIFLFLALCAVLRVPAFATDGNIAADGGAQDIDVSAKYVDSSVSGTVYSVDMTWGAMEFTYTKSGSMEWDPTSHEYKDRTTDGWVVTGNEILVVNHSNAEVKVSFAYEATAGYTAITGSFSHATITLPSAEGKALDAAELIGKTELTLSGTLGSQVTAATKVGKVTVILSK